ncbi:SdpI family protein [Actinomyces sp. ZJ308]|uniref:SdpI family protein n=1 Tax=Actinomyces sp. ZJ308 TaxID=2708342 RepID=UPI0014202F3F|nr:SdpI family protein [Actinomyces sp. ZJ308]
MAETAFSVLMILLLGAAGILLLVMGCRMSQRRLPPNSWAGVRYAVALQSEENWYEMQAQCATATAGLGVVLIDSAVLFAIQAFLRDTISVVIPMVVMLIQVAAGIALLHVRARKYRTHLLRNAK